LIHQLAGGIHEALWTTIEGLIFGITFMLVYYYYQKKMEWVYSKWEEDYVYVIERTFDHRPFGAGRFHRSENRQLRRRPTVRFRRMGRPMRRVFPRYIAAEQGGAAPMTKEKDFR
jgi:hypothetical protein